MGAKDGNKTTAALVRALPDEKARKLLLGAVHVLTNVDNPARHLQFSCTLRTLFEHLLHTLAPDASVVRCAWFSRESRDGRPTRRQRAIYATQGGMGDDFLKRVLKFDPAPLHKRLIEAIDVLSKFTHAGGGSLVEDQTKINQFATDALDALTAFQTAIGECRERISQVVMHHVDAQVLDTLITEALDEIDVLATHHYLDKHDIEEVVITIDESELHFHVYGSVSFTLQWGSDGDWKRGDGVRGHDSFPFTCTFTAPVDDPSNVEMDRSSFSVETLQYEFPGDLNRVRY